VPFSLDRLIEALDQEQPIWVSEAREGPEELGDLDDLM
jgi:hypothetical protein